MYQGVNTNDMKNATKTKPTIQKAISFFASK